MKAWLADQLSAIQPMERRLAVVLDPNDILDASDLTTYGVVVEVRDWYGIRRTYEQEGRRRPAEASKLVILVHSPTHREPRDLPYDINEASQVVRVRVPVPLEYRRLVLELPDDLSAKAVGVCQKQPLDPVAALLAELWGVALPGDRDPVRELDAVVRLRSDPTVPPSLWPLVGGRFRTELAQALARQPADPALMQRAWEDFLDRGSTSPWAAVLTGIGPRIGPLFYVGLLRPAGRKARDLPGWTAMGGVDVRPQDRVEELRAARPEPWLPTDVGGWARLAEWWGELRAALADTGGERSNLTEEIWALWHDIDQAFGLWLQSEFGPLMSRSAHIPLTVDKIAPFLARRIRTGVTRRLLFVVVDGMGLAQWATIRRMVGLEVVSLSVSFAMIPTLTPISRQAIFAGRLPRAFPDTLRTTDADERRWKAFWAEEGFEEDGVRYVRTSGANVSDIPHLGGVPIVGIVVQAVDEVLHAARVLGDAQGAAGIRTWAEHGFLRSLVERAYREGYEVWLSSDHGNLEALPHGKVQEGLAVESAGVRVRWYTTSALRDGARAEGIAWDPPGLPPGVCYPLFAPGRSGYFTGARRVTHGGFSLDEVVVPFASVLTL